MDNQYSENNENITEEITDNVQVSEAEDAYAKATRILKNQRSKQYSTLALVFALMAYPCSCACTILGIGLAAVAIVFALMSKNSDGKRNIFAIVAVIIAIVAIITGISATAVYVTTVLFDESFMEEYNAMLEEMKNSMQQAQ
ncbi:MAG: hypothetical protein E7266_05015 [Lachnospiraceae bacterium]|nr:hypothetical protein [Lachnospiraceae bacterium]